MEFIIWVETRLAGKTCAVDEIAKIDRNAGGFPPADIGLTRAEGKEVVSHVQRKIVQPEYEHHPRLQYQLRRLRSAKADEIGTDDGADLADGPTAMSSRSG